MSAKQSKIKEEKISARKQHKQERRQSLKVKKPALKASKQSQKQRRQKRKQERRANKKPRRRIFPIWLRLIVVFLLCAVALIGGLLIGYGMLGDGVARDVLKWETWQHIIDIVNKSE